MSNRVTTAPHEPVAPLVQRDAASSPGAALRGRWGARRRVLVAVLVVLAILTSVAGVYAWQIVSTLTKSQGSAIVPLPTMSNDIAFIRSTSTPTATAEPPTSTPPAPTGTAVAATSTPLAPAPTLSAAGTSTSVTPPSSAEPTATATATPTTTPAATPTASPTATPPAPGPTASPTASATPTSAESPLVTSEDLSRLEVAQEIVAAGMRGGDPGASEVWQGKTYLNILVLGIDKRPDGGDQNSDVILIARVDLIAKTVNAVSLPRDLLVDVPGVYSGKINGAYNAGVSENPDNRVAGIVKVRDTIYALYGIPIDAYVLIDFNGFEAVIDAVGGVDVTVEQNIVDPAYPTEDYGTEEVVFLAGRQRMDGETALKYVRTRNTDDDDARRERQIDVLLALFDKGKSFDSIRHADELIVALSDTVQTNLGLAQQLTLARVAREVERADITLTTLEEPLITPGTGADGAWVYLSDPAAVAAFIEQTLAGTPTGS